MSLSIPSWANKLFIWSVIAVIILAHLAPEIGKKGGFLKPEITVKYGAVSVIFLISGLSLKTEELGSAMRQYHLHIFIQSFSLIFTPVITEMILSIGKLYSHHDLMIGFTIVSCMPPPVSSAVILTKEVGGNEAAAVFNSALGSFLGIFLTPALLFIFVGSSTSVPFLGAFFQLSFTIVFPVMTGQFLRFFFERTFSARRKILSTISSAMLLLIIYTTFCETLSQDIPQFDFVSVIITIIVVLVLQSLLIIIVFCLTNWFDIYFSPDDTIAAIFCATHKSLTLGFPLLKVLYEGEPKFVLISFPLLVYHPMQILLGSLLVPFFQSWLQRNRKRKRYRYYPV